MKIKKYIAFIVLILWSILTGIIYFYKRSLIYENGKYFNEENTTVYLEQSIPVYLIVFCISLVLTLLILFTNIKKKRL